MNYKTWLYIGLVQAAVATVGSLYASLGLGYTPCDLCWYQRIFMYPLVLLLAFGIYLKIPRLPLLLLPLSIGGGLIALYHVLLQAGVVADKSICSATVISCAVGTQKFMGIATLPQLSLIAFAVITICLVMSMRQKPTS